MHDHSIGYLTIEREVYTSEKSKLKKEYFESQGRFFTSALDVPKDHIITARNYYSGKRDMLDFEYLEDVYGMQNPIELTFTNIIKPRVDALVGMSILAEPDFMIAYTDKETIAAVAVEKHAALVKALVTDLDKSMQQGVLDAKNGVKGEDNKSAEVPGLLKTRLDKLSKKYGEDFESAYTIGAQHILNLMQTDSTINLAGVKKEVSKDYFVTGEAYTREIYMGEGKDPLKERILPEELFSDRPARDTDLKRASVVVNRRRVSPHEVIRELGDKMTKKEAELLFSSYSVLSNADLQGGIPGVNTPDIPGGGMDTMYMGTGWANSNSNHTLVHQLVDFYHIEWLASTRIPNGKGGHVYREDRYEVYRVGTDLFLCGRRCDEAPRKRDTPWRTTLSYNGIINTNPSLLVRSMVNDMREIQDLYDIMLFFRNNAVATSGVSGSRVNIAAIPKVLGKKFMDRLTKWTTIRKQGMELIDPTEEGAQLFQHYGDFNAAVSGDSINAINAILESLTQQADIISSVPRQMLGIIEQRDAVENVKTGINQVSVLSLEMFRDIDMLLNAGMQEALDYFKYAYRNKGKEGIYRNGMAMLPFVLDPSKFSNTEYKITVVSSGIENAKLLKVQALAKELVQAGSVAPDVLVKIINRKSIVEVEHILTNAVVEMKEQQMNMGQLQQQLEESGKQVQQLEAEIKRLENNAAQNVKARLDLDTKIAASNTEHKDKELALKKETQKANSEFKGQELQLKRELTELEKEQMMFGTGKSKEINNNGF